MSDLAARLAAVRERIESVEREWTHQVEITAVTKAHPPTVIHDAVRAGCRSIGENYAQELLAKRDVIEELDPELRPRVDFIGSLQSNKVRQLVGLVDRWCTVDRTSLVDEIAKRVDGARVLIQVNTTGEDHKGGCAPDDAVSLVQRCRDRGLVVEGLFGVGPTHSGAAGPDAAAPGFRTVRAMVDELGLDVTSIGMSGDLEVAVACGATDVRLGTALFGPRAQAETSVHPERTSRG